MAESAGDGCEPFQGQPSYRLHLPNGDSLRVMRQGAQPVSWVSGGRERLYLSPHSCFDGHAAIRGGVPICFPQFNQRGPLPKHGFARNLTWRADAAETGEQYARLTLRLPSGALTHVDWPFAVEAMLTLELRPGSLQMSLDVCNIGPCSLFFTGALHTYLAVRDIAVVELEGLAGQPEWDALTDRHGHATGRLRFDGEFDRVYDAAGQALVLHEGSDRLGIEQSPVFANTVVWNPGGDKCAALPDMPADGYRHMLCVEAAQVMQPVALAPGARWQGWQRLSTL